MAESRPTWFLREWRVYLKQTQEQLAEATGMHKGDVSGLERGKLRWNSTHLDKFAKALHVERWWIVDVNPLDPDSDLEILDALRRVPANKRADVRRIVAAVAEPAQEAFKVEEAQPAPMKRRRK